MYGGKFAFQKLTELACSEKEIYHFFFYFVFEGKFQVQAPRGLIFGGAIQDGGFFALRFWGAYIWRGLFSEF